MKKIQDSFTSITVNTVKTVRKFLDKSDQQIARGNHEALQKIWARAQSRRMRVPRKQCQQEA